MSLGVFRVNTREQEENDWNDSQEFLLVGPVLAEIKLFKMSLSFSVADICDPWRAFHNVQEVEIRLE